MLKLLAPLPMLALLALPGPLFAYASAIYQAATGSVTPALQVTMNLSGGGSAVLNPVLGPNCYLGMTCAFPSGYVGTSMSYTLPDGSTATLTTFHGWFVPLGNNQYGLSGQASGSGGQASGSDSTGRHVTANRVLVTMGITCRSGRGGGCSKAYTGGVLILTR